MHGPASVRERIAALERELCELRQQQRQELAGAIAATVPAGVVFSAAELFERQTIAPALRQALEDANIHSVRQLGKRLAKLAANTGSAPEPVLRLVRIGIDRSGVLWLLV